MIVIGVYGWGKYDETVVVDGQNDIRLYKKNITSLTERLLLWKRAYLLAELTWKGGATGATSRGAVS